MRSLTLRQLRALRAVADTGAVSAAARELNVTPPAISMQVKLFEDMAGLPLLERIGERFVPTPAGAEALRACRAIEATIEDLSATFESLRAGVGGQVCVGIVSTAKYFATRMIGAFAREHPGVRVSLVVGNRDHVIRALAEFRIDLAIMGRPPAGQECASDLIGEHPHVVVADPAHRLAGASRIDPRFLSAETFVVREPGSGTRALMETFFERAGVKPTYGLEIDSNETIKQAVMAGLGIAFISAHTVTAELADGRLVKLDVAGLPLVRHWYVLRRLDRRQLPASRALQQFIVAHRAEFLPAAP
ncbi:MAG: LysR family transcriptional regulator [Hyphomicrobiales bacterium]|nr:LysR family transcriptional regulator [Hyphomicrobiales bacterium]